MDFLFGVISVVCAVLFFVILTVSLSTEMSLNDKIACVITGTLSIVFGILCWFVYNIEPIITMKHVINTEYKVDSIVFNFSEPTEIDITEKKYKYSIREDKITIKTNTFIMEK